MRSLALAPLSYRSLVYFLYLLCLCPIAPLPTPCLSCARALLFPRRCSASSASRLRLVSPIPCSSVLIPVSFRPRSKDPFRLVPRVFSSLTPRLFVSYPVSSRLLPRVFSSRTPCLFVLYPVSFRLVPRVFSSRTPCLFVMYPVSFRHVPRVLSSPTSCNLVSNP